MQDKSSEKK